MQSEAFRTVEVDTLGLVVQNFVSFMVSLSPKFVNYIIISTSKANTLIFNEKFENSLQCKGFSNFFNKNNSVFVIFMFKILTIR